MPPTNFPYGVTSFGCLLPDGGRFSSPWATHYFVDGTSGSDANNGKQPSRAFATITQAAAVAVGGDVIYIRPQTYKIGTGYNRYSEDVTIALGGAGGSAAVDTNANISIIGVTSHPSCPTWGGIRWTYKTATPLTVNAAGLHIENIGLFTEGATYGILLQNNGATNTTRGSDGFSMYHCALKGKGLYVLSGGTGVTIDGCRFEAAYNGVACQINYSCSANPGRHLTIRNCEWLDGNGTAPDAVDITIAAPMSELLITGCQFSQLPTGNVYIATAGANYGLISNCFFNHDDLDTDAEITLGTGVKAVACYDQAGIAATS